MNFVGKTLALDDSGLNSTVAQLNVPAENMWAVLHVETAQCGFLPDRRPRILFERHIFHKLTGGSFDSTHPDVSNPSPGGYGAPGASQYTRLNKAMALHPSAALRSASWGIAQIMGEYFHLAGFASVETMVSTMIDSENAQLEAFTAYLKSTRLDAPLRVRDWTSFARRYNGPDYARNSYDTRLSVAFQNLASGTLPDLNVRAGQLYLMLRSFSPDCIDGMAGSDTHRAILAFQAKAGLPQTGQFDDRTMKALIPPSPDAD